MRYDIDKVALQLAKMGAAARSMPPSWDGGRCAITALTPEGHYIGKLLPGKGLYLDQDLKYSGISKKIPYVFERTLIQKVLDKVRDERFAINTAIAVLTGLISPGMVFAAVTKYDDVMNDIALGQELSFEIVKGGSVTAVANAWMNIALMAGNPPALTYTNIPGGAALDNSTTGSFGFGIMNPIPTGKKCYLVELGLQTGASAESAMLLVDLLVGAGNINANATGAQTVNSTALTRYTTGSGVMIAFEVTTALGATASNITASYTNQSGTAAQAMPSQAMTTSAILKRLQPITTTQPFAQLATNDYGVQSVQTVTMSAAMGAGVLALNLVYPLVWIPTAISNYYIEKDFPQSIDGLIELVQTSGGNTGCLSIYELPGTTSTGVIDFHLQVVIG